MNKDIRKLLSQKVVTGEQVGQALIRDMVHLCFDAYAAPDEPPEPLLTEEEKHRLVAMLADPQDVRVYGQYRSVQAYLSSYQLVFSSVSESVESAFARIYSSLVTVRDAEQIYAEFVEEGVSPELSAMKSLRDMGFSGVFGQLYEGMRNTMDQFYQSLRMCVAHERGLEIVAARIQVPGAAALRADDAPALRPAESAAERQVRCSRTRCGGWAAPRRTRSCWTSCCRTPRRRSWSRTGRTFKRR